MIKISVLLYLLLLPFGDLRPLAWSEAELAKANTAVNANYLTEEEKQTIMLVNLARLDGKKYLQTYFQQYKNTPYAEMSSSGNKYMVSLKADLDKAKNLPMLKPDVGLSKAAKYHAKDAGKNGIVGHTSSNGMTMSKRLPKYVKGWNRLAENCSYGFSEATDIVGQLLLDEDVPSLGHRKSILDTKLEFIGVAIAPHTKYKFNCVMDLCAKFKD
jgi:uncharacterized protein YkwD